MPRGLKQLLKKSSVLMLARIVGGCMAFALNILIARWMGAETLGAFALCMAFASLVAVALPAGMQSVGVMFISQYKETGQLDAALGYLRSGYRHIAVLGALSVALSAVAYFTLANVLQPETLLIGFLACLTAPALAVINFQCSILTGFRHQLQGLLPDLIVKPGLMFCSVVVLGLAAGGASPAILISAVCAAMWLTALSQYILMRRTLDFNAAAANADDRREWRKASLPWIAITLMWDYFIELHLILAGFLLMPAQVGLLHICFRLRVLAAFGIRALSSLVMPEIYAANASDDDGRLYAGLAKVNILTLIYAVAVCGGVLVAGNFVLGLVGEDFQAGYWMLLMVCASMIPRAAFGPATAIMSMKGLPVPVVWVVALGVVLALVLCLALYPLLGVTAIAVAYLVSTTFISVGQWFWALRTTGLDCSIFAPQGLSFLRQKLSTLSPKVGHAG